MLDGAARRLIGPGLDRLGRRAGAARHLGRPGDLCRASRSASRRPARSPRSSTRSGSSSSWRAGSATGSTARSRATVRDDRSRRLPRHRARLRLLRRRSRSPSCWRGRRRMPSPARCCSLSFYVNGASFLAYAIMAERRGLVERGARAEIALLHHRPGGGDRDDRRVLPVLPVPRRLRADRLCLRRRSASSRQRRASRWRCGRSQLSARPLPHGAKRSVAFPRESMTGLSRRPARLQPSYRRDGAHLRRARRGRAPAPDPRRGPRGSSSPTESRTSPSPMPSAARSSSFSR